MVLCCGRRGARERLEGSRGRVGAWVQCCVVSIWGSGRVSNRSMGCKVRGGVRGGVRGAKCECCACTVLRDCSKSMASRQVETESAKLKQVDPSQLALSKSLGPRFEAPNALYNGRKRCQSAQEERVPAHTHACSSKQAGRRAWPKPPAAGGPRSAMQLTTNIDRNSIDFGSLAPGSPINEVARPTFTGVRPAQSISAAFWKESPKI